MNKKTISIVIPSYNHANSLVSCLESIFQQTKLPYEIIVIDDGSIDDTSKVIEPYLDRVNYVYQENEGAPSARNHGFRESSGNYVIFCDADVVMRPQMLEEMITALEEDENLSFAYSGLFWGWKKFIGLPFSKERLFKTNYIHTTSLIRSDHFPGFDENLKRLQDWDLWLTMIKQGRIGKCVSKEPLYKVRVEGESRVGSSWLPKMLYKVPWYWIGWAPKKIVKYQLAKKMLKQKHKEIV